MNRTIEFHDSVLSRISERDGDIILRINAYIHESSGNPGIDPGTGWIQEMEFEFGRAVVISKPNQIPCSISDGEMKKDQEVRSDLIQIPIEEEGGIELILRTEHNEQLVIKSCSIHSREIDPPRFVEEFKA